MLDLMNTMLDVATAKIQPASRQPEEVSKAQRAACFATLLALRAARAESEVLLNVQGDKAEHHPMTRAITRLIAHCEEGIAEYDRILKDNSLNDLPF